MATSYSNIEAQEIIASANAAAVAIGELIRERLGYELEIAELYKKLLDQGGNELAGCISLVRTGPGKYRTPAAGKKGGTASDLYLAATSGTDAVIETRSGTYNVQECYKRVLAAYGSTSLTTPSKTSSLRGTSVGFTKRFSTSPYPSGRP